MTTHRSGWRRLPFGFRCKFSFDRAASTFNVDWQPRQPTDPPDVLREAYAIERAAFFRAHGLVVAAIDPDERIGVLVREKGECTNTGR